MSIANYWYPFKEREAFNSLVCCLRRLASRAAAFENDESGLRCGVAILGSCEVDDEEFGSRKRRCESLGVFGVDCGVCGVDICCCWWLFCSNAVVVVVVVACMMRALTRVNLTLFMFDRMRSTTWACFDQRTSWSCMAMMKSPSLIPALFNAFLIRYKYILIYSNVILWFLDKKFQ